MVSWSEPSSSSSLDGEEVTSQVCVFASRLPHGLGFIPLGLGFIIWGFFTRSLICAICVLVSFLGLSLAMNGVALFRICRLVVYIKNRASGLLHLNLWTQADVFLYVLRRRYVA